MAPERVTKVSDRGSFIVQHIKGFYPISLAPKGDFIVDHQFTFEVGGSNKKMKQINNLPNAYLLKYDIEVAVYNQISLWLFLY